MFDAIHWNVKCERRYRVVLEEDNLDFNNNIFERSEKKYLNKRYRKYACLSVWMFITMHCSVKACTPESQPNHPCVQPTFRSDNNTVTRKCIKSQTFYFQQMFVLIHRSFKLRTSEWQPNRHHEERVLRRSELKSEKSTPRASLGPDYSLERAPMGGYWILPIVFKPFENL